MGQLALVFALKFLAALGYFGFALVLSLFLSENLGFSDREAGLLYGLVGMLISVYSAPVGWCIDAFGCRRSLLFGCALLAGSRCALAAAGDRFAAITVLCTGLPVGEAFVVPALGAAVGRLSGAGDAKRNYGIFYTVMNVGVVCVGPAIDWLRTATADPFRAALCASALCGALSLPLAACLSAAADCDGDRGGDDDDRGGDGDGDGERKGKRPADDARTTRSFFLLLALLCGVRSLFRHLDATFPKYFLRRHGPNAPLGLVYSLEPLLIIFLVPLTTGARAPRGCPRFLADALARGAAAPALTAITVGCYVGTLAPFCLALRSTVGGGVAFVATMAVGEAVWAPRFYAYTNACAPKGRAGAFFALAQVPLFLPKMVAGVVSGDLLHRYCPGAPCADGPKLWLAIALVRAKRGGLQWTFTSKVTERGSSKVEEKPPFSDPGAPRGALPAPHPRRRAPRLDPPRPRGGGRAGRGAPGGRGRPGGAPIGDAPPRPGPVPDRRAPPPGRLVGISEFYVRRRGAPPAILGRGGCCHEFDPALKRAPFWLRTRVD